MVKVSVIVPVYNGEKYISKCINSIIKQTFKDIEIIVIDDGSTDNTYKIIKEYGKRFSNFHIIRQENKGVSEARNIGLDTALGEYVLMVDSDDFIREDMIEVLYSKAKENNADISRCGNLTFFGRINLGAFYSSTYKKDDIIINPREDKEYVFKEMPNVWNKLIRRDLFDDIRFREGMKWEDGPVIRPITAKANKVVFLNDKMYMYRTNLNNTSIRDFINPTEKILDVFTGLSDLEENFRKIRLYDEFEDIIHEDAIFSALLRVQNAGLWFKLSKEDRIKLTNYIVNIIEIRYGDWINNKLYLDYKSRDNFFKLTMNYIEKYVLDERLRKETEQDKVYKNVHDIFSRY